METYYTIEEKYLQAVEEMRYGEPPLSLKLLNEILAQDALYVRAHYQLGVLYYYDMLDYQSAGYHFKLCTELEPTFPDVYFHYIHLLVFLNKAKLVYQVAQKAVTVPGVDASAVYGQMGLCAENNRKWADAIGYYNTGLMLATSNEKKTGLEESIDRVKFKMKRSQAYVYTLC